MTQDIGAYAVAEHTPGGTFGQYHGPAATSWGPDRIDLYAAGDGSSLLHRFYDRGWSGWETISPSEPGRDPTAPVYRWQCCSWGAGRLDAFGVKNGHLEHVWYDGGANALGWGNFDDLGGEPLSGYLTVAAPGPGRIEVMALDEAGGVHHRSFGPGGWSSWATVDVLGHLANPLMLTSASPGRGVVDLFTAMAGDNPGLLARARHTVDGGWGGWEPLGRGAAPVDLNSGSLAAASDGARMWLFALAAQGGQLMSTRELEWFVEGKPRGWTDWEALAPLEHGGSACSRGATLHVFGTSDQHPVNVYFEPARIEERDIGTEVLSR